MKKNETEISKLPSAIQNMTTIQEVHEYYQKIIRCMPNNVYFLDRNCITQGCNDNVLKFVGLKNINEFIGIDYDQMGKIAGWSEGHAELYKRDDMEVMSSGVAKLNVEDPPIHDANGEPIYYLSSRVPIFDDNTHEVIGVVGISVDITERKKMEEDLRIAKEKAEAGERAKTEFIANTSHDIRTPLTGIISFSEYLRDYLQEEEYKEIAGDINKCGKQLLGFLNDVLELSSVDSCGEEQVVHKSFDLYELIDDLCALEKPAVASHHLELHQYVDKKIPRYLISDKMKLHRVLLNLIGNAIKFTEQGSVTIEVKLLEQEGKRVSIGFSVRDTGIGIPEEAQQQVFDRFYKVNSSYKAKYTGNGIGLHIVQKYTHLLGGEINFKSKEGEGTTFSFALTLPLGESTTDKDADYEALLQEEKNVFAKAEKLTKAPKEVEARKEVSENKPRVLLIEDNAMALKTLTLRLKGFDITISEAMDAEIAFELIKQARFDLIITDIGLPGISGDELVVLIRKYEQDHNLKPQKIVALTGHATEGEFGKKCMDAGMNALYKKPIETADLHGLITPLLAPKEEQASLDESEPKPIKKDGKLGMDLPDTEEELFQIDQHPLFDISIGAKVFGSEQLTKEIHQDFKNATIGKDLDLIKQYHEEGNWDEVERLSHKIKGGTCYGTVRLHYALLYMERYLKAGHKNAAEKLYAQMLRVIDETLEYLDKNL